jgi:hypothetical protein
MKSEPRSGGRPRGKIILSFCQHASYKLKLKLKLRGGSKNLELFLI